MCVISKYVSISTNFMPLQVASSLSFFWLKSGSRYWGLSSSDCFVYQPRRMVPHTGQNCSLEIRENLTVFLYDRPYKYWLCYTYLNILFHTL